MTGKTFQRFHDWMSYRIHKLTRRCDGLIQLTMKGGTLNMQTYLTKSADDNSKLVFWAVKGIMNDMMSQAADSENTSKFVAFAVAAMSREKEIPSFSVPGVIRKMMEDSDLNRKAGIAAPCGNGQCSDEQCETCLSNPHLPKAEVTLSDLTRGAKF